MTKEIIWSPAAENDFEKILKYLEFKWSNRIARRFINKVDDSIDLIVEDPKIFPLINEELQIRKSVITKQNTLFYRVTNSSIEIVRLFDTRQDPNKLEF
ncbi:type II toxin-antitoxin system RelE/ParE family toxin [Saccharicrinis sp. FJH2]|uniref:type II toxin-antitoxin system RelE/ParE family toxin n=1 Tax=Saccharicrinis sp. FJH65 TaxID=3344659 RepID=UPI0035F3C698